MKVFLSFDDTGSMSTVRKVVRQELERLLKFLFTIPDMKVGVAIHNDYCDPDLLQIMDFTSDQAALVKFINRSSSQGGGDSDEAYAYVLHEIGNMSWGDSDEEKSVILIADANPHEKGYRFGRHTEEYDWRLEARALGARGIKIYAVQALGSPRSAPFYTRLAQLSGGIKLDLAQFDQVPIFLQAIVAKENNDLDNFQATQPAGNISIDNMFAKLRGHTVVDVDYSTLGEFQVCAVRFSTRISEFVERMGLHYQRGAGYYELVNTELVQANKEVLFVDRISGEVIRDTIWCREQLGLPYGTKGKVSPHAVPSKYRAFIQSNSYTRNLDPGTEFLYKLDAR